jgi:peptide/nickel transport system substrate-binding protein
LIFDAGSNTDELAAQIIQSNLAEVGITVTLTGLETGAFLDRAFGLDADMMIWNYGAVSPSIADPLNWILGTGVLFTGTEPTALTDAYLTFVSATDPSEREQNITEIQDMMLVDQAALPLAQFSVRHAIGPRVTGLESTPWGLYYYDTLTVN